MHRFKYEDLFELWCQEAEEDKKFSIILSHVREKLGDVINSINEPKLEEKIRRLCRNFRERWCKVSRSKDYFKNKNAHWLKQYFIIEMGESEPSTSSGRPKLTFSEKSDRSKRREASQLSQEKHHESSLMVQAAGIAARREGKHDLAQVLKQVNQSPSRPTKIRKVLFSSKQNILSYTPEEALELILDCNLSRQQYLNIRHGATSKNCNIYPDYKEVWKCKSTCRPVGINVSDTVAKVPIKNLLEHTTKRIVELQEDVIMQHMELQKANEIRAMIYFSYGFDGSSGQSLYKQKFDTSGTHSDESLFATTCIPLRLVTVNNAILWNNRTPQSVRFCRPIKLEFVKESAEHVIKEKEDIDKQIEDLEELRLSLPNDKVLNVKCNLFMTLIDGKILNILTGTKSSQVCPICGATPKDFLKFENFVSTKAFAPNPNTLQYGISTLHAWIRFFECLLHISYRHELSVWQVRGEKNKLLFQNRKKLIQERFLTQLHLLVDKPKSNGFGSTNDGNTARRAFKDVEVFSKITDVDENLIKRFKIILICLSCQFQLDGEKFNEYCIETARLYISKYPWYPMPATVHKILAHGKQIIENTILPIGYFGEEGSEARNKFYKHDRLFHARKMSRQANLEDVFNRAMDTSDPVISSINLEKRIHRQRKLDLPPEVINLLSDEFDTGTSEASDPEEHEEQDEETYMEDIIPNINQLDVLELDNDTDNEM